MTENDEHQLPLTDDRPTAASSAGENPAPKKSPRRKVSARPKTVAAAPVTAPDQSVVTPPKPRRKAAVSKGAKAEAPAPAQQQAELLPKGGDSRDPQAHVETRVIPPAVIEAVQQKNVENFGGTGEIAPPPSRREETLAPRENRDEPRFQEQVYARNDDPSMPARRDDRALEAPRDQFNQEPRRDERGGGGEFRRGGDNRDNRGGGGPGDNNRPRNFQGGGGGGGGQFQDRQGRHNRHGRQQQQGGGGQPQQPRDGQGNRDQFRDQGPRDQFRDQPPRDQFREQGPRDQFRDPGQAPGGDALVSRPTEIVFGEGIIEVSGKGFGFLREAKRNFVQTPADIFVTPEVCRKYNLRDGQWIKGEIRRSSRGPQLFRLTELNGEDPEKYRELPNFDELTTINPNKRIKLETVPERYTTRVMDLMTPIGKGQRGLIVAPPRTGKTTLLQHIAESVVKNHPEMKLIILLVDERPEEVTELRRTVPQAEMMASSNDSDLKSHTRIAQLAMERAKRLVEANFDVFILLDSITRVGRAFNNATGGGGRTMSGGIDARAMEIPRKIFAAARNTEEAGSLTIMATALIDTGSKMDEVIFQEFKGTGNMELVLDRKISDQRIYPAVDIFLSGTRREELLLAPWELDKINVIRRGLAGHKPLEAIERLLSFLKKFPTNAQMLASLPG